MDVSQIKKNLDLDLYDKIKIIDGSLRQEQERHLFLENIAKRLFGSLFSLEQNPVFFCITDDDNPDIAFVIPTADNPQKKVAVPTLYITKGLFNIVQNEDQLAFILSYELKFLAAYFKSTEYDPNTVSELNSLKMMINARYNVAQARSWLIHMCLNSAKYHTLAAKIFRAFQQYPDNESVINALNLKIQSLKLYYQKQNIDIFSFDVTEIPAKLKADINNHFYKSSLRRSLESKNYDSAGLIAKQDIIIAALKEFTDTYPHLSTTQKAQIEDVILSYVAQLRQNMPLNIISRSDYELFKGYNPVNEEIRQQHWQAIFQTPMPASHEQRIAILQSFPQKIVEDDEVADAIALHKLLKERQTNEIASGLNANVLFWDKLLELESKIPEGDYLSIYNGCILSGIENIDIGVLPNGKKILEELEKIFHNQEDPAYPRRVWRKFSNIQDYFGSDNPNHFLPEHLRSYPHREDYIFKKFKLDNFPKPPLEMSDKDIGKNIPQVALRSSDYEKILGINAKEVYKGTFLIQYQSDYRQAPFSLKITDKTWFYITDDKGIISNSFSPDKKEATLSSLLHTREDAIYKHLADELQKYRQLVNSAAGNPETVANLDTAELLHIKTLTGPYRYVAKNQKLSAAEYAKEIFNDNSDKVHPQKQPIEKFMEDSFYTLKTSSEIYEGYGNFNQLQFNRLLKPDMLEFINSKYNLRDDNAVFEVYLSHIIKDVEHAEYGWKIDTIRTDETELLQDCQTALKYPQIAPFFSQAQFIKYYNTLFEKIDIKKLLDLGLLNKPNTIVPELKNLAVFAVNELNQNNLASFSDVDFSKYRPLFHDRIASALNLTTDFANLSEETVTKADKDTLAHLRVGILLSILSGQNNSFPLELLAKYPIYELKDLQKAKLGIFLTKAENYPKDIKRMAATYRQLYNQGLIADTQTVNFIIKQIKQEADPRKALDASLELSETLNKIGDNKLKDSLIKSNPAFNTDLFGKIRAYQKLAGAGAFADDYVLQNQFLEDFIPQLETIREPELKNSYYDIFINKQHRIADPDIRRRYHQLWVQSVFAACGSQLDDKSEELYNKVKPYAEKLHGYGAEQNILGLDAQENLNQADRLELSRLLTERFVSQKRLSYLFKPYPATFMEMSEDDDGCRVSVVGFATIKQLIKTSSVHHKKLIEFLISFGTAADCKDYADFLNNCIKEAALSDIKTVSPQTLDILYHEFWGYPLEARAVILGEVLQASGAGISEDNWENLFNIIKPRMFPYGDEKTVKICELFIYHYIKSHKHSERLLLLAAMMATVIGNATITNPLRSISHGLCLFLEHSGPVATRVAQSASSCIVIPKFIRNELKKITFAEQQPSRWELFEWLDFYNHQDQDNRLDYGADIWLGRILESNPYFVTLEKGSLEKDKSPFESSKTVKIVYASTKASSDNEFKAFKNTIYALAYEGIFTDGIDFLIDTVQQTRNNVQIETDLSIGHQQLLTAQQTYNGKEFEIDGYNLSLRIADWSNYGTTWAEMERSHGSELESIKNLRYRQVVNKIYFSLELCNILSGYNFDHRQLGWQIRIDTDKNIIGIFDSGAKAVILPSADDKYLLGQLLYQTFEKLINNNFEGNLFRKFAVILSNKIDSCYRNKQATSSYLSGCLRRLLDIVDFYKDFNVLDFVDCINNSINDEKIPIDKDIIRGFVDEGIKSLGIFSVEQSLLSSGDKNLIGGMLFNMYADSFKCLPVKLGSVIKKEIIKAQQQAETKIPLLKIMADKIQEMDKTSLSPDIPKEFMPNISDLINRQDTDIAILKGIMKEVIYTVSLQENNRPFSPEDRYEFGRLLYDTFNFTVAEKGEGAGPDMVTTYMMLYKSGNYKSQYAAKIAAVISIVKEVPLHAENGLNAQNIVRAVMLSGKSDKEIVRGMADTFKSRNPNSLTRTVVAKGLEQFLAEERTNPNTLKRFLIKMFVRKRSENMLTPPLLHSRYLEGENSRKLIGDMIQNYINKLIRLYKLKKSEVQNQEESPKASSDKKSRKQ